MNWTRVKALIVKELLAIFRDPRGRIILIAPPLLQLFLFSYAATLEVKNADILVLNRDSGRWGQELERRLEGSPSFKNILHADSPAALKEAIDMQRVIAAIQIDASFSRDIEAGQPASLQIVLDGRRSNAAQIVAGYLNQIVADISSQAYPQPKHLPTIDVVARNWFNPNLNNFWFIVPGLLGTIAMLVGLLLTALSIARERELGTFDQLMVSPLKPSEILIGKLTPPMLLGLFHVTLFTLVALLHFHVPLRGSLPVLYISSLFYLAALAGVGLFISSLSMTQQQAILGAFLVMVPMALLSGFATPIDNMPGWFQMGTYLNPLRYFLVIVRGVFLKDLPLDEVLANILPMAGIAVVTLSTATWLFRRRLE